MASLNWYICCCRILSGHCRQISRKVASLVKIRMKYFGFKADQNLLRIYCPTISFSYLLQGANPWDICGKIGPNVEHILYHSEVDYLYKFINSNAPRPFFISYTDQSYIKCLHTSLHPHRICTTNHIKLIPVNMHLISVVGLWGVRLIQLQ